MYRAKHLIFLFLFINIIFAQLYIPAEPFNIMSIEEKTMMGGEDPGSLIIRPIIPQYINKKHLWSLKFRSEFYYNSSAPNLENTSDRWVGKGVSFFTGANIAYKGEYIFASTEPYYFISQNDDYDEPTRLPKFNSLNDNRPHSETPYKSARLRETQIYLNYNGLGGGYSNANMWWGSGIHSSLMMSSNTTGFGHLMLGTISEQKYKNWGFNGRYVFSKFGKKSISQPYYSGFIVSATYYSVPTITFGISRSFLSGGKKSNYEIGAFEAALLPFEIVRVERPDNKPEMLDPIDQTFTGYVNLRFPKSDLILFLEWGRNEGFSSFKNAMVIPDHTNAFTVGLRKYGIFNSNIFIGIEYTNIARSRYWKSVDSVDWYDFNIFDYYNYDGRPWAAHSGPDSDDFKILLGYNNQKLTVTPSFNYERHGMTHTTFILLDQKGGTVIYDDQLQGEYYLPEDRLVYRFKLYSETKMEFGINIKYHFKNYILKLDYEHERVINYNFEGLFIPEGKRRGNVVLISVEKILSNL